MQKFNIRHHLIRFGVPIAAVVAAVFVSIALLHSKNVAAITSLPLSTNSSITLDPEGDLNHNGQIDGGDTIKFTFQVTNPSDKPYTLTSLKTHIDSSSLNYIHNMQGMTSLGYRNKTIVIPNLYVGAGQALTMSFEAVANYTSKDATISVTPDLQEKGGSTIATGANRQISIEASSPDPSMYNVKVQGSR